MQTRLRTTMHKSKVAPFLTGVKALLTLPWTATAQRYMMGTQQACIQTRLHRLPLSSALLLIIRRQ